MAEIIHQINLMEGAPHSKLSSGLAGYRALTSLLLINWVEGAPHSNLLSDLAGYRALASYSR